MTREELKELRERTEGWREYLDKEQLADEARWMFKDLIMAVDALEAMDCRTCACARVDARAGDKGWYSAPVGNEADGTRIFCNRKGRQETVFKLPHGCIHHDTTKEKEK